MAKEIRHNTKLAKMFAAACIIVSFRCKSRDWYAKLENVVNPPQKPKMSFRSSSVIWEFDPSSKPTPRPRMKQPSTLTSNVESGKRWVISLVIRCLKTAPSPPPKPNTKYRPSALILLRAPVVRSFHRSVPRRFQKLLPIQMSGVRRSNHRAA